MEPNNFNSEQNSQPVSAASAEMDAALNATPQPEPSMMQVPAPKKKTNWMMIMVILFAVLAAGGIGFGAWAWMDGSSQVKDLNDQVSSLKKQNSELLEQVNNSGEQDNETDGGGEAGTDVITGANSTYKNPIIQSKNSEKVYYVDFGSSYIFGTSGTKRIEISLENGKVSGCAIFEQQGDGGWKNVGQCNINGLEGNIYKVVEFGAGHSNEGSMIGFIMEDGRVAYFRLYDFDASSSADATRYLKIDKIVTDALRVNVSENVGGYGSTIFVMSDGSFVEYNESMLE